VKLGLSLSFSKVFKPVYKSTLHHSSTASQQHCITAALHHSSTASQQHCITAALHHSGTAKVCQFHFDHKILAVLQYLGSYQGPWVLMGICIFVISGINKTVANKAVVKPVHQQIYINSKKILKTLSSLKYL
jgi:hypothetical protein